MTSTMHSGKLQEQRPPRQTPVQREHSTIAVKIVSAFFTMILTLSAVVFLFLAVGPRFLGYQTSTMLTGSMAPGINPGDVVVSVPVPADQLRVGDVITYSIPVDDRRVETHRIVEMSVAGGVATVVTKGDANSGVDPWKAVLSAGHVHRHVATVPHLGTVIRTLREPGVRNVLLYGATAVGVAGALACIWSRKPDGQPGAAQ